MFYKKKTRDGRNKIIHFFKPHYLWDVVNNYVVRQNSYDIPSRLSFSFEKKI